MMKRIEVLLVLLVIFVSLSCWTEISSGMGPKKFIICMLFLIVRVDNILSSIVINIRSLGVYDITMSQT